MIETLSTKTINVIDSHTGGEPTRIVVSGGPDLGGGSLVERMDRFSQEFDEIRNAIVNEPRGSAEVVGGMICEPADPKCAAGVIFFNNTGFLGMCGHGTIGLLVTLKHLGRIEDGAHLLETPVGLVATEISGNQVAVQNVPSYRLLANVELDVPGYQTVVGDVAWGGNWFFLVKNSTEALTLDRVGRLTEITSQIKNSLEQQGITGADGALIDHIELFGPAVEPANDSRNFVLCPGGAYDRSPCGTGTSAKLACLAADGKLKPGELWRQESIIGSVFTGSYQVEGDAPNDEAPTIVPTVTGEAFVCGEAKLILNPDDPFCMGIA